MKKLKLCPDGCRRTKQQPCPCGNDSNYDVVASENAFRQVEIYILCGSCGHDPTYESGKHFISDHRNIQRQWDPWEVGQASNVWDRAIRMNAKGITEQDIQDTMPPRIDWEQ